MIFPLRSMNVDSAWRLPPRIARRLGNFACGCVLVVGVLGLLSCDESQADVGMDEVEHRGRDQSEVPRHYAGTRLRPTFLVGADGSRDSFRWYDTELETHCSFRRSDIIDSLGNRRRHCLPETLRARKGRFFADEECKKGVDVVAYYGCSDYKSFHFVEFETADCGKDLEVYRIKEARLANPEDRLWVRADDDCYEVSDNAKPNHIYLTLEGSGNLDQFVAVSE